MVFLSRHFYLAPFKICLVILGNLLLLTHIFWLPPLDPYKYIFFVSNFVKYLFIYLFMAVSGLSCGTRDLSLQHGTSSLQCVGFSLVVARGLSSCSTHGLSNCGTWAPERVGSVVVACRLSCLMACGVLVPNQGLNPCPLRWRWILKPLDYQGSPCI